MNKFDTIVKQVEGSLITEAPEFHPGKKIVPEFDANVKKDVKSLRDKGELQQSFEDFEVILIKEQISSQIERMFYYFVKGEQIHVIVIIDKTVEPDVIGYGHKRKFTTKTSYTLLSISQIDQHEALGLAIKIVLEYFSKIIPHLISGKDANERGRPFWKKILPQAQKQGFEVIGYLNGREVDYNPKKFDKFWKSDEIASPFPGKFTSSSGKYFKILFKEEA